MQPAVKVLASECSMPLRKPSPLQAAKRKLAPAVRLLHLAREPCSHLKKGRLEYRWEWAALIPSETCVRSLSDVILVQEGVCATVHIRATFDTLFAPLQQSLMQRLCSSRRAEMPCAQALFANFLLFSSSSTAARQTLDTNNSIGLENQITSYNSLTWTHTSRRSKTLAGQKLVWFSGAKGLKSQIYSTLLPSSS